MRLDLRPGVAGGRAVQRAYSGDWSSMTMIIRSVADEVANTCTILIRYRHTNLTRESSHTCGLAWNPGVNPLILLQP